MSRGHILLSRATAGHFPVIYCFRNNISVFTCSSPVNNDVSPHTHVDPNIRNCEVVNSQLSGHLLGLLSHDVTICGNACWFEPRSRSIFQFLQWYFYNVHCLEKHPLQMYRGVDKSLVQPGWKQANVSVRMA